MNVLLVDDDRYIVDDIEAMLAWDALGIQNVYKAYGMRQAQNIIQTQSIDILICDIEMPHGSGIELVEWMRNEKVESEVLFLTGHAKFDYARQAINYEVREYFLKPVKKEELEQGLQKVVATCTLKEKIKQLNIQQQQEEGNGAGVEEEEKADKSYVEMIKEYLQLHYNEDISRKKLAEILYLNPDYIGRLFRKETGKSISEYLLDYRMEKAYELLAQSDKTIRSIAEEVGYDNVSYFIKQFRRIFGKTPTECREIPQEETVGEEIVK